MMSTTPSYVLTDKAKFDAAGVMLKTDAILQMVRDSAKVTHPYGNRRYKGFVFDVFGNEVRGVAKFQIGLVQQKETCVVCGGEGKLVLHDECPNCFGETCEKCNYEGTIRKEVQCRCQLSKKQARF